MASKDSEATVSISPATVAVAVETPRSNSTTTVDPSSPDKSNNTEALQVQIPVPGATSDLAEPHSALPPSSATVSAAPQPNGALSSAELELIRNNTRSLLSDYFILCGAFEKGRHESLSLSIEDAMSGNNHSTASSITSLEAKLDWLLKSALHQESFDNSEGEEATVASKLILQQKFAAAKERYEQILRKLKLAREQLEEVNRGADEIYAYKTTAVYQVIGNQNSLKGKNREVPVVDSSESETDDDNEEEPEEEHDSGSEFVGHQSKRSQAKSLKAISFTKHNTRATKRATGSDLGVSAGRASISSDDSTFAEVDGGAEVIFPNLSVSKRQNSKSGSSSTNPQAQATVAAPKSSDNMEAIEKLQVVPDTTDSTREAGESTLASGEE